MTQDIVLDRHIVSTSGIRGGKPRLAGTRITVADVVLMHLRLGHSLAEIAGDYDLSLAAVHTAMAYYYDHRDEIETEIQAGLTYAEAMADKTPSLLQQKLKAVSDVHH